MSTPIGYVLKRFPRLSQTFVLRELLAHQAAGAALTVFSHRRPRPEDYHAGYGELLADVVVLNDDVDERAGELSLRETAACLVAEVRRRGIGHLHAHFANIACDLAQRAADEAGIGYSVTTHARDIFHQSVDPDGLRRRLLGAINVITISQFNARHLVDQVGIPAPLVKVIYNGLQIRQFEFSSEAYREPWIVAVGRLIEKKGLEDLIDALAMLRTDPTAPRLAIIGAGPLGASLRAQISRLGLDDRAVLLGAQPPEEVLKWLRRAQVVAAPCRVGNDGDRDGLPTVLLEAMALGAPCVATPVTGIPEAIEDGASGLLVPERDPPALAAACRRLLVDRGLAQRLARAARATVEQRFDVTRNAAELRQLWARTIA